MKRFFIGFGVVALFGIVVFTLQFMGLTSYKFFAPKYEEARREVFENTQSYVEGKRQELVKYRLEHMTTEDEAEKNALKMTILSSTANLDKSLLSYELQTFLRSLEK